MGERLSKDLSLVDVYNLRGHVLEIQTLRPVWNAHICT